MGSRDSGAGRRPGAAAVILLALSALGMVVSFAFGCLNAQWAFWIAAFGVMELWAAINRVEGATLSERVWAWIGRRPLRPSRWLRVPICAVFFAELLLHFVTTGAYWWSGGTAVVCVALPFFVVVTYALAFERKEKEKPMLSGLKTWVVRKFARGPLEKLQKDLQQPQKEGQPMKLSPTVKTLLWFVGLVIIQAGWDYYGMDKTPTVAEGVRYVVTALIAAALFWTKSGRLPSFNEVKAGLAASGNISIANDNPLNPVRVTVGGEAVPKAIVLESLIEPMSRPAEPPAPKPRADRDPK